MPPLFGPAGNSDDFYAAGYKRTYEIFQYLSDIDLDAYEYQCGKGTNVKDETAFKIREESKKYGITVTLHAPYYISLASPDEEKRQNSVGYILKSAELVKKMGGNRIVVHSGSVGKMDRKTALELAKDTAIKAEKELKINGLSDVFVCFETMGKINQLGTLEEVLELCSLSEYFIPTIDFGHLNARTHGEIKSKGDYKAILDSIEDALGRDKLKIMHCHFSKIEYTEGGEKRHLTFEDEIFGPDFEPLAELLYERDLSPVIICESSGTQSMDALAMKKMYKSNLSGVKE